jgi:hypothetical protein
LESEDLQMKLKNTLPHMRGKAVLVNGTIYTIDEYGFADIGDEADSKKLLAGAAWVNPSVATPAKKAAPRKSGFLIVEDKKTGKTDTLVAPEKEDTIVKPDENTPLEELKTMADGLGLKYRSTLAKAKLLKRVLNAMKGE